MTNENPLRNELVDSIEADARRFHDFMTDNDKWYDVIMPTCDQPGISPDEAKRVLELFIEYLRTNNVTPAPACACDKTRKAN